MTIYKALEAMIPKRTGLTFFTKSRVPRPFLKWAGGKGQLLPELVRRIPEFKGRYFEPFLGGGALFFFLAPEKAAIWDINEELIHCYCVIRDQPDRLIEQLGKLQFTKEDYYRIRGEVPEHLDPVVRAARTIYLNRTGFNGLYRVNSKGIFNVPMGRYTNPTICDKRNIKACATVLSEVDIRVASFEEVLKKAKKGDFVYFDPPYIPISRTSNFTKYQKLGFSMDDQAALADVFAELTNKEVYAMLSNSDVPWIHEAYNAYNIHRVSTNRAVNSKASGRGPVGEVIVTNY